MKTFQLLTTTAFVVLAAAQNSEHKLQGRIFTEQGCGGNADLLYTTIADSFCFNNAPGKSVRDLDTNGGCNTIGMYVYYDSDTCEGENYFYEHTPGNPCQDTAKPFKSAKLTCLSDGD